MQGLECGKRTCEVPIGNDGKQCCAKSTTILAFTPLLFSLSTVTGQYQYVFLATESLPVIIYTVQFKNTAQIKNIVPFIDTAVMTVVCNTVGWGGGCNNCV